MKSLTSFVFVTFLLLCSMSFSLFAQKSEVSAEFDKITTIWKEILPYAVPLPPSIELRIDKSNKSIDVINAHHSIEAGKHVVLVSAGLLNLTEDEIRTLLAHELGHAVLRKFTGNKSSGEIKIEETEAHIFGAELFSRMGLDASSYVSALENIIENKKDPAISKNDPIRGVLTDLEKRIPYINAMPLVYLIIENRILNSDFETAKQVLEDALAQVGYSNNYSPFDDHILGVINYLSLRTSTQESPADQYSEYFQGHLLLARSTIIPSRPLNGRFRGSSPIIPDERPDSLKNALIHFKKAIQAAPYWIEARINYQLAADMSVNVYRVNDEIKFAQNNADEINKSIPFINDKKVKLEAYNALAVWYAGRELESNQPNYTKVLRYLDEAQKNIGCINKQVPNAWQICYNGNILSRYNNLTIFNKFTETAAKTAMEASKSASQLLNDINNKKKIIDKPIMQKGGPLPEAAQLRAFFGNPNKDLIAGVENSLRNKKPKEGITVLENGNVVIYRDGSDNISLAISAKVPPNSQSINSFLTDKYIPYLTNQEENYFYKKGPFIIKKYGEGNKAWITFEFSVQ